MIWPRFVMGPIEAFAPALSMASPAAPGVAPAPPPPPLIVPLLISAAILPELAMPAPPIPPANEALPPFPPLIVPLLVSLVIVPPFDTRASGYISARNRPEWRSRQRRRRFRR